MNRFVSYGLIGVFLLISMGCTCIADDGATKVIYLQGGESTIANVSDDMYEVTVQNLIPYFQGTTDNRTIFVPVKALASLTYPLNAAIIISGPAGDTTTLVTISNASLSEENTEMVLQATPLKFYEGEALKSFSTGNTGFNTTAQSTVTGIYMETVTSAPTNNMGCSECESKCPGLGLDSDTCHHTYCCVCCGYACWL